MGREKGESADNSNEPVRDAHREQLFSVPKNIAVHPGTLFLARSNHSRRTGSQRPGLWLLSVSCVLGFAGRVRGLFFRCP